MCLSVCVFKAVYLSFFLSTQSVICFEQLTCICCILYKIQCVIMKLKSPQNVSKISNKSSHPKNENWVKVGIYV